MGCTEKGYKNTHKYQKALKKSLKMGIAFYSSKS